MLKNLVSRLMQSLLVLFVLFTVTFFLVKALPGDPLQGDKAMQPHIKAKMENFLGLDQPMLRVQKQDHEHLVTPPHEGDAQVIAHRLGRSQGIAVPEAFSQRTLDELARGEQPVVRGLLDVVRPKRIAQERRDAAAGFLEQLNSTSRPDHHAEQIDIG